MLVRFVTYLHTGRLVDRTVIPKCEEIRRLYQRSVPLRPRAKHISLDPAKDHPLARAFIRELDARNAGWQKRAKYACRSFCAWLGEQEAFRSESLPEVDVMQVTGENLLAYFNHLDDQVVSGRMSRGTFRLRIQAVRRWFEYLYLNSYIYSDPTVTLPVVKGREKAPHRIISIEEARRYLDIVMRHSRSPLQDMAIVACLSGLGLRPSEVTTLRVADLDRAAATLRVQGKGNKERSVPLAGPVLLSLERHLAASGNPDGAEPLFTGTQGGPLRYEALRIRFHTFKKLAMIERPVGGPHVFRHYFITQNLLAGADLEDLAAVVGHDNIRSMESYFHTTLAGLRAAVLRAYGEKETTK